MLSCRELTEVITDYLEGRMTLWQRLQFHMHLGMCRHCRLYLKQMRVTVAALGKVPDQVVPDDVHDDLMRRFSDWKTSD